MSFSRLIRSSTPELRVLPQSTATNAYLARQAFLYYQDALHRASALLAGLQTEIKVQGTNYYDACTLAEKTGRSWILGEGKTFAAHGTTLFLESYFKGMQAAYASADLAVAVADAERAVLLPQNWPNFDRSPGRNCSRAAAAQILVGGMNGLLHSEDFANGFCSAPLWSGLRGPPSHSPSRPVHQRRAGDRRRRASRLAQRTGLFPMEVWSND